MIGRDLGSGAEQPPTDSDQRSNSPTLKAFATWAVVLATSVASLAALALILRLFYSDPDLFRSLMIQHVRGIVGIPLAAVSAFCVLLIFEARAGKIEFEVLGLRFRGGSGPAVIWVFGFLAIVSAIRILF